MSYFYSSSNEDDDLEEEEEEVVPLPGRDPDRPPIYDVDAMHDKLESVAWPSTVSWEESLAITSSNPVQLNNVNDDIARELAFYQQAVDAMQVAQSKLEAAGIPWKRPVDYLAEMVKSDDHMKKVQKQLDIETKRIQEAEQRRQQRDTKKFMKQVAASKQQQKQKEKKLQINNLNKLRKQRARGGYKGDVDVDAELETMNGGRGSRKEEKAKRGAERGMGAGQKSKKREYKDSKFGFGGPKRAMKQNNAASAADMGQMQSLFNRRGGGRGGRGGRGGGGGRGATMGRGGRTGGRGAGGRGGGRGGGGGVNKRQGKSKRMSMKSRSR